MLSYFFQRIKFIRNTSIVELIIWQIFNGGKNINFCEKIGRSIIMQHKSYNLNKSGNREESIIRIMTDRKIVLGDIE